MNLEDDMLTSHVRLTMGELMTGAEQLKGLAENLDGYCDMSSRADPDEMRRVAVGVKATATHALLTAAIMAGLSERLNTVAAVLESAIPPEEQPPSSSDSTR